MNLRPPFMLTWQLRSAARRFQYLTLHTIPARNTDGMTGLFRLPVSEVLIPHKKGPRGGLETLLHSDQSRTMFRGLSHRRRTALRLLSDSSFCERYQRRPCPP